MLLPILLVIHVFSAAFWYGSAVFLLRFVMPAAQAAGEAGGTVMREMTSGGRLRGAFVGTGTVTVLSGLALLGVISNGYQRVFMSTPTGLALSAGALCGFVALALGIALARGARSPFVSNGMLFFLSLALFAMVISRFA